MDGDHDGDLSKDMNHLKINSGGAPAAAAVPDMDDIPDMEEESLEETEDDAVQALA